MIAIKTVDFRKGIRVLKWFVRKSLGEILNPEYYSFLKIKGKMP
jgi:hypothetical protein